MILLLLLLLLLKRQGLVVNAFMSIAMISTLGGIAGKFCSVGSLGLDYLHKTLYPQR
jgi:hypothetical protein